MCTSDSTFKDCFPQNSMQRGSEKMGGTIFVFLFLMDFLFVCFVYVLFLPTMDACGGKCNEVNEGIGFHMFLMIFSYQWVFSGGIL